MVMTFHCQKCHSVASILDRTKSIENVTCIASNLFTVTSRDSGIFYIIVRTFIVNITIEHLYNAIVDHKSTNVQNLLFHSIIARFVRIAEIVVQYSKGA